MDAALAGLIGALGGSVIGAGGAWGAALVAFRGARYQADRQVAGAHEQWLRQVRRETYAGYLAQVRSAYDLATATTRGLRWNPTPSLPSAVELRQVIHEVREAYTRVELEAPRRIRTEGYELMAAVTAVLLKIDDWIDEAPSTASRESIEALQHAIGRKIADLAELCAADIHDE
ncbi:hypothetical protein [Streptomyces alboniger]|uniref:Uncharacterized protein n=1 Tax=Streptomyces alboniger TaxID=132473 RepID=A0A5J6HTS3_STRAD|nr:hypothetical protein [Streptomyces alboniger]QEV21691.1 hypothetical protein CP975_32970 [Streptomyces alboniger]